MLELEDAIPDVSLHPLLDTRYARRETRDARRRTLRSVATIRGLEELVEEAAVSGDTAFLEKIFGDGFTSARTTGEVEDKAQLAPACGAEVFLVSQDCGHGH
jgi:hypothetical protein